MKREFASFGKLAALGLSLIWIQETQAQKPSKPAPDIRDGKYGRHEGNEFDLWKAKSSEPTPLVIYIHGGSWQRGSKGQVSGVMLDTCLKMGISVASINYRLAPKTKYPDIYLDCARAVQHFRYKAKE